MKYGRRDLNDYYVSQNRFIQLKRITKLVPVWLICPLLRLNYSFKFCISNWIWMENGEQFPKIIKPWLRFFTLNTKSTCLSKETFSLQYLFFYVSVKKLEMGRWYRHSLPCHGLHKKVGITPGENENEVCEHTAKCTPYTFVRGTDPDPWSIIRYHTNQTGARFWIKKFGRPVLGPLKDGFYKVLIDLIKRHRGNW